VEITDVVIVAIISGGMSVLMMLIKQYFDTPTNAATVSKTNAETLKELWATVDSMRDEMEKDRAACNEREASMKAELEDEREARRALAASLAEAERTRRQMAVVQAGMDRQIKELKAELKLKDARIDELERKLNGLDTGPLKGQS